MRFNYSKRNRLRLNGLTGTNDIDARQIANEAIFSFTGCWQIFRQISFEWVRINSRWDHHGV